MSKYNWNNIPLEIKWIATDEDGVAFGFTSKPKAFQDYGLWLKDFEEFFYIGRNNFKVFNDIDWKDSLEERPND